MEESFIHALRLAELQPDLPLLEVFYTKNKKKLDLSRLKKLAPRFNVESQLTDVRQKAEFYEKMRALT